MLAKASSQSHPYRMNHRIREQARSHRGVVASGGIAKHLLSYRLSGFVRLIRPIEMQAVRVGNSHDRAFYG